MSRDCSSKTIPCSLARFGLSIRQLFLQYRPPLGRSVERGSRLGRQCALTGNLGLERREPLLKLLFFNQGPLHFGAQRRVFPGLSVGTLAQLLKLTAHEFDLPASLLNLVLRARLAGFLHAQQVLELDFDLAAFELLHGESEFELLARLLDTLAQVFVLRLQTLQSLSRGDAFGRHCEIVLECLDLEKPVIDLALEIGAQRCAAGLGLRVGGGGDRGGREQCGDLFRSVRTPQDPVDNRLQAGMFLEEPVAAERRGDHDANRGREVPHATAVLVKIPGGVVGGNEYHVGAPLHQALERVRLVCSSRPPRKPTPERRSRAPAVCVAAFSRRRIFRWCIARLAGVPTLTGG